ncbi:MAG TPA: hypothetical protein VJA21_03155 [Verrucomicrobiae bacterium]
MKNKPDFVGYSPEIPEQIFRPAMELSKEASDFQRRAALLSGDVECSVEVLNRAPQDQFWSKRGLMRL